MQIFSRGITPQRIRFLVQFVTAVRRRTLNTQDLMLVLLMLREVSDDAELWEWGSAVAHSCRNQGRLWRYAAAIWSTHEYYGTVENGRVPLSPLPEDIYLAMRAYLRDKTRAQIDSEFGDLFETGITRDEILSTLEHHYARCDPKKRGPREREAFYYLISLNGTPRRDRIMIRRLILAAEGIALNWAPVSLDVLLNSIEKALRTAKVLRRQFTDKEKDYLQVHALVAFHGMLLNVDPKALRTITGKEHQRHQPVLFVNSFENFLSLDLGFLNYAKGRFLEPAPIRDGTRWERYHYPLVSSTLWAKDYLIEADWEIRLALYNHPLQVVRYKRRPVLIAHDRRAGSRYPVRVKRYDKLVDL